MPFSGKNVEKLELTDLESLLDNKVQESKHLDYKLAYGWSDKERRELLSDISAFANTAGGYIVIGVKEKEGRPDDIPGVKVDNADHEKLKILNLLRDGIEPRLPSVSIKMIPLANGNFGIVIAILKSWVGPHVVIFDKHWRVYVRTSGGKNALDVAEMRQAFLMSETLADKIRTYNAHRVGLLASDESCCTLENGPRVFINIIPFTAFSAGDSVDIASIKRQNLFIPILGSTSVGTFSRFNVDGILSGNQYPTKEGVESYCQFFRSGVAESAHVDNIYHSPGLLAGAYHEGQVISFLERILAVYQNLEVPPPFAVFLTLVGVKGCKMYSASPSSMFASAIDRNIISLPEVILHGYETDIGKAMKPAYDAMWNSAGWERCPNYDAEGNWKDRC
jgi:hypothetical protein